MAHPVNFQCVDEDGFSVLIEPYRHELQVHCYRMMGSLQDAEDMVQETLLRAWRRRETYAGRASLRAWLYKIATNACLDVLDKRPRRAVPLTRQAVSTLDEPIPPNINEPVWLEPYPDDWLATNDVNPESELSTRENITLAFIAALHLLPPRQRAVLILRDVLDWQASETAVLLDMTVSAVKSALHRARETLAKREVAANATPVLDEAMQHRLKDYVRAWEMADIPGLLALLKADATFSMPPIPSWYQGRETIGRLLGKTIFNGEAKGRWKLVPTRANGQLAFGLYRHDPANHVYRAYAIQVLTFVGREIADITTFRSPSLAGKFGLADVLRL